MDNVTALARVMTADTKISRSEIIELIIEEMTSEVDEELKEIQERLNKLQRQTFSFDEVKHLIGKGKVRFAIDVDDHGDVKGKRSHMLVPDYDNQIPVSQNDPDFGQYIT